MTFEKYIYYSSNIDNLSELIQNLKHNKFMFQIYCICINNESPNLMEIIPSQFIHSRQCRPCRIIGIAKRKHTAYRLSAYIIQDYIHTHGTLKGFKEIIATQ